MSNKDYEYHGMIASSWDLLRGDTANIPDRKFFRDVIKRSGEPVLIVGCGTGRLLLEYLADGIDVDGVGISPEMRDYTLAQLSEMFRRAGYTAIHSVSGFSNQPASEKDKVFVIFRNKPMGLNDVAVSWLKC